MDVILIMLGIIVGVVPVVVWSVALGLIMISPELIRVCL